MVIVETNEVFFVNNQTGDEFSIPVIVDECKINPELNKTIVHDNDNWNKILLYIRLLEKRVDRRTRAELVKFRDSIDFAREKAWQLE